MPSFAKFLLLEIFAARLTMNIGNVRILAIFSNSIFQDIYVEDELENRGNCKQMKSILQETQPMIYIYI